MSEKEAKSEMATNSFCKALRHLCGTQTKWAHPATVVVAAVCLLEYPEMLLTFSCSIAVSVVDLSYHWGARDHKAIISDLCQHINKVFVNLRENVCRT